MCFSMSSPNRPQAYNPPTAMDMHFHQSKPRQSNLLGKPLNLSAFHLDDFLRPLISDENHNTNIQQIIHTSYYNPHSPSSSTSSSSPPFALPNAAMGRRNKGVEDVWFHNNNNSNNSNSNVIDLPPPPPPPRSDWLQFQMGAAAAAEEDMEQEHEMEALGQNLSMQQGLLYGSSMMGDTIGYNENQIGMTPPPLPSSSGGFDFDVDRKRRFSDDMIDKTIERKQKRMIKNRESAARSRARKQAYTNKLEQDVSMLKEANAALEKEMVLMRLPFDPNLRPKYQLRILPFRRANSATF